MSAPPRPATATVPTHPDDAGFEADFADLAARFAAKSGGGLSPELSADLALEIVLNEIVEQACLATGATGAAIVLRRDDDMICRATSGTTSPDLGSRLDMSGGISGECVKTLRTVRCDDALTDKRADVEASQRLGVRSVMVMPLLRGKELVGAFELFSSRVAAFGDRDERTLEALAGRTLKNLARAAEVRAPQKGSQKANGKALVKPAAEAVVAAATENKSKDVLMSEVPESNKPSTTARVDSPPDIAAIREVLKDIHHDEIPSRDTGVNDVSEDPWWKRDFSSLALTAAVVVCTLLFGMVVAKHFQLRQRAARAHAAPTVAAASAPQPASSTSVAMAAAPADSNAPTPPSSTAPTNGITIRPAGRGDASAVPPGGLRIYENGKEVFRATPPRIPSEGKRGGNIVQQAAAIEPESVKQLSPEAAEEDLLRRVEPVYPEQARTQKIQGAVVLDVRIGANGAVEGAQVVSGDPLLAQASTDAVKQWRYKPRSENGRPVQMQTRVTLNFRLPQ